MEYALLQAVFIPLLLSPVAYIIGRKSGANAATWFTFGVLLYCTILVVLASLEGTYEEHYAWTSLFGEFGFLIDGLASPFAIIIYVLCTILALYSKPYMVNHFTHQYEELQQQVTSGTGQTSVLPAASLQDYINKQSGLYFALFLAFSMGMLGTVLATI